MHPWLDLIPVRLRKFMGVGAFMTIANDGLLILLVDGFSIPPTIANASRTVVMTQAQLYFTIDEIVDEVDDVEGSPKGHSHLATSSSSCRTTAQS